MKIIISTFYSEEEIDQKIGKRNKSVSKYLAQLKDKSDRLIPITADVDPVIDGTIAVSDEAGGGAYYIEYSTQAHDYRLYVPPKGQGALYGRDSESEPWNLLNKFQLNETINLFPNFKAKQSTKLASSRIFSKSKLFRSSRLNSSVMKEIEVEVYTDDPELESLVKDSSFFKKSGYGYLVNFTDLSLFNQELPAELKNKLKVKTKYGEQVAVISSANLDLTEYEAIALLAKYGYKEYGSGNSYIRTFYTTDSEISIYVIDGIVADIASSEYGVLEAPSKQEFIDIISDRVPN